MKTINDLEKRQISIQETPSRIDQKEKNKEPKFQSKTAMLVSEKLLALSAESIYNEPALVTRYKKNLDNLANRLVTEMLCGVDGNVGLERIQSLYSTQENREVSRPIPRTWPKNLISAKEVRHWADALTKRFDDVYDESGMDDYAQQMMAEIFDVATAEEVGLPDHVWNLCVMLDKQVIEQCLAARLPLEEINKGRMAIIDGFLLTRIISPHMRPVVLRYSEESQKTSASDKNLCKHYQVYFQKLFAMISSASESQLSTDAKAMLGLTKTPAKPQKKASLKEMLGSDYNKIDQLKRKTEFLEEAKFLLDSNYKNRKRLLYCLLSLYKSAPDQGDELQEALWNKDVEFFFENLPIVDGLSNDRSLYFYDQLELMGTRHKKERTGDRNIAVALNTTQRILPTIHEADDEDS